MKISMKRGNKNDYGSNFVPPDGGFGWLICISAGISNMWIFCIFQNFGIIYRDKFGKLGLTIGEITTISSIQTAIAYFVGFLSGPLLKRFTFRQIAFLGSTLFNLGIFWMSFASSYSICILSYGLFVGSGTGLCFPSSSMAINTYFKQKRRVAHSIAWTITGLGQVFMPIAIKILLNYYNEFETTKIVSALCFHMFPCILIYQPVLWHTNRLGENAKLQLVKDFKRQDSRTRAEQNFENSPKIIAEFCSKKKKLVKEIVAFFDLDFLKNPVFLNIELAMIFPYLAEINFGILTPIFLNEFGFKIEQIVLIMTSSALFDIVGRLLIPLILGQFKFGSRLFYLVGLAGQMITIIIVAETGSSFYNITFISYLGFGLFKGIKTVYMQLILPEFVPLNRLSGAIGLNNLLTGLSMLSLGSHIGMIRDRINFFWLLYFLGFLIFVPIVCWILEYSIKFIKNK